MSGINSNVSREERADRILTLVSGWGSILFSILGIHSWVSSGTLTWWGRAGVILGFGLFVMWIWAYLPLIWQRLVQWKKSGGLNTTLIAIALVVGLVMVNVLVRRRVFMKFDLTKNQRYTLSERSRQLLKSLKEPLKVTVFIPAGRNTAQARDLFRQYAEASDRFQWSHVDPIVDRKTVLAMRPRLNEVTFTGAVIEYGGRKENVTEFTEKDVTSSILKLTREAPRQILFLKGHGEPEVTAQTGADPSRSLQLLIEDLKTLQWPVESLDLYPKDAKAPDPDKVAVVIIAGPQRDLAENETKLLDEYLNKGGRALLMLDPSGPTLSKWLATWGVKTGETLLVGQTQGGLVVSVPEPTHQAVKPFAGGRVIFPPLRQVTTVSPAPSGITAAEILKTAATTQLVENFARGTDINRALSTAPAGAYGVAVSAEKQIGTGDTAKTARLIVIGDSQYTADSLARQLGMIAYNLDLTKGLINFLGEEPALVAIPPKDENTEQAFLTPEQGRLLSLIHFWDFPLLALVLAIVVYMKRR